MSSNNVGEQVRLEKSWLLGELVLVKSVEAANGRGRGRGGNEIEGERREKKGPRLGLLKAKRLKRVLVCHSRPHLLTCFLLALPY